MECTLCPRECHALREDSRTYGFCNSSYTATVTRAAPHFWEEPCISGQKGSGTVFFAGCHLRCVYCQNHQISRDTRLGKQVSPQQLQTIFDRLKNQGVHNINLVTPTHFVPAIVEALEQPIGLPVVYNSSGYERLETLKCLEGKVQIYLPDLKYMEEKPAREFSNAPDYPEIAKKAIREMFRQVGPVVMDEDGILQRGVCIRHLILPGHTKNTLAVIHWVANTFPKGSVLFSLMSQYTPTPAVANHPTLYRRITKREYEKCVDALWDAGLTDGFVQDLSSAKEEYTPPFDLTGI
ncbi:MAG: radical SAM protein [Clostridia bacterium]|nr:radical SAM protein [Clostridia bacterium]